MIYIPIIDAKPEMTAMRQACWPHDIGIETKHKTASLSPQAAQSLGPDTFSHFTYNVHIISNFSTALSHKRNKAFNQKTSLKPDNDYFHGCMDQCYHTHYSRISSDVIHMPSQPGPLFFLGDRKQVAALKYAECIGCGTQC